MNSKSTMWIFMLIGSSVGGLIPTLWGASYFSISSVLFTALGGIIGIWLNFKITN
jgi:hypothetical protein